MSTFNIKDTSIANWKLLFDWGNSKGYTGENSHKILSDIKSFKNIDITQFVEGFYNYIEHNRVEYVILSIFIEALA